MTKRVEADAAAEQASPASAPAASSTEMIAIRWTPAPGNMTTERRIDDYLWTPGSIVSVPLTWWNRYDVALRTSPHQTFEVAAD